MLIDPIVEEIIDRTTIVRGREANPDRVTFDAQELEGETVRSQTKMLALKLYSDLHVGHDQTAHADTMALLPDDELEQQLIAQIPRPERVKQVRVLATLAQPRGVVVDDDGLRVFYPEERVAEITDDGSARVRTASFRPRLSAGFLFFNGYDEAMPTQEIGPMLRVYCAAKDAQSVVATWHDLVHMVCDERIHLRTKVLSRAHEFPRRDAIVVYLPPAAHRYLPKVRDVLAINNESADTSRLVRSLGDGVGIAWEPEDRTTTRPRRMSFGEHRCEVISDAVVRFHTDPDCGVHGLTRIVENANIDPLHVYRNLSSPELGL